MGGLFTRRQRGEISEDAALLALWRPSIHPRGETAAPVGLAPTGLLLFW
jgi:hypothetical protein